MILCGGQANAITISQLPRAEQAALQRAIQSCGLGRKTITDVDYKDGYKMGRIANPNAAVFMTVQSVAPDEVARAGLNTSRKTEVNFYRVGGEPDGTPKSFSFDGGEVCQYIFAFPIANENVTEVPRSIRTLGWLPAPRQTKYIYVFRPTGGTQFISNSGDVKSLTSEVAFPAVIPDTSVIHIYEIDSTGAVIRTVR